MQTDAIAQHMYDVKAARARFDAWKQHQENYITRCVPEQKEKIQQHEEHISDVRIALAQIQKQSENNSKKMKQREAQVSQMKGEQRELQNRKMHLEHSQTELEAAIENDEAQLSTKSKDCLEPKVKEIPLTFYDHTMLQYKKWMGISINKQSVDGNNALKITFTLLDHLDPNREFIAHMYISKENRFRAGPCNPDIDLSSAIQTMNETNDLGRTVRMIRKAFKRTIQQ
eukprot:CFRG2220T1